MSIKKFVCLLVIFGLLAVTFASGDGPSASPASDAPNADAPKADSQSPSADGSPSAEGSSNSTEVERNFDFNFGSDQIEARIRIREGASESEVRHELRATSSGAEFRVEFEQKAGDTENRLRLRLRLFELIEYVPDQTPGYQNETIVNTYNTWEWGKGFADSTVSQTNDSREFTLTTADGIFSIVIRINRPVEGNLTINPEDVKFDVQLNTDAMRTAGWLNGTTEVALSAALVSRLETEQRQEGSDEHAIALGSSNATQLGSLAVSWINYIQCGLTKVSIVPTLRVDNNQTSVEDGDDADSTGHVVSFAFVDLAATTSETCIWDPVVGANRVSASVGTPSTSTNPTTTNPSTNPTTNPTTGVPKARTSGAASAVASLAVLTTALVALF